MSVYAYLRASTEHQDATRALTRITQFCEIEKLSITETFIEYFTGTAYKRPQLDRLLNTMKSNDIVIIESIDRLTRMNESDSLKLLNHFNDKEVILVALDNTASIQRIKVRDNWSLNSSVRNSFDNGANQSRTMYDTMRTRQREGIDKAVKKGRYKGRVRDEKKRLIIADKLRKGYGFDDIAVLCKTSKSTISDVKRNLDSY